MSLSIRNQIHAALATDAEGLTTAAGYSFTQRSVVRKFVNVVATRLPLPLVMLLAGEEEHNVTGPGTRAAVGQMAHAFELIVAVVTESETNVESIGLEMLADVVQLYTNLNRTITLTDVPAGSPSTTIVGILPITSDVIVGGLAGNRAGAEVHFQVLYRTKLGNPRWAA